MTKLALQISIKINYFTNSDCTMTIWGEMDSYVILYYKLNFKLLKNPNPKHKPQRLENLLYKKIYVTAKKYSKQSQKAHDTLGKICIY